MLFFSIFPIDVFLQNSKCYSNAIHMFLIESAAEVVSVCLVFCVENSAGKKAFPAY